MPAVTDYIASHFKRSSKEIGEVEQRILDVTHQRKLISTDTNAAFSKDSSLGERLADGIARVGGSWGFIISFMVFLVVWAIINTVVLTSQAFDPYPFVFLNLILSMLAAIQAPIIMMSQNRQGMRDRFEAAKDYEVNLKAELEVLSLHEKSTARCWQSLLCCAKTSQSSTCAGKTATINPNWRTSNSWKANRPPFTPFAALVTNPSDSSATD